MPNIIIPIKMGIKNNKCTYIIHLSKKNKTDIRPTQKRNTQSSNLTLI